MQKIKDGRHIMLDLKQLNSLKQNNVSKDAEKTKARVREFWAPLPKPERDRIAELAKVTKYTVERTYKKGTITPRLAASFSAVLKINPYYMTGESDSSEDYTDEALSAFIKEKKPAKSRGAAVSKKRSYTKKSAAPAIREVSIDDEYFIKIKDRVYNFTAQSGGCSKMTEDEILSLVKGLLLRAKYNGDASDVANMLKFLLTI